MARNDYENSANLGEPINLYRVVYGENAAFLYTNSDQSVTYDGEEYFPHPIAHGDIENKGKVERMELKVTVPLESPIADLFRVYPPGRVVSIVIREGHIPNPDAPAEWALGENFPVAFTGRILESRRQGNRADLTCEYASASMRRVGLRRHYQWSCPLALYSQGPGQCNADKAAATSDATVAASGVAANRVTLEPGWGAGSPGLYVGGILEWNGPLGLEARTIYRVEGDTLVLDAGVDAADLPGGTTVSVVFGCAHTMQACAAVHDNIVNYGGHPWITTGRNPLNKNNHV